MRNNNFDILRLICALLVIVSHSYALLGIKDLEPIYAITHSLIASDIGLCGFFTISGYLISNSLVNSKSLFAYLTKRCLRIFPGLLVCLLVTIIGCSVFYDGDIGFWNQKQTYSFLWKNLSLYRIQWDIPGVFKNNFMSTINGSLWTLAHEFTLYFCMALLFFAKNNRSLLFVISTIVLLLCLTKNVFYANNFTHTEIAGLGVNAFSQFAQCFAIGMILQFRCFFRTNRARLIIIGTFASLTTFAIYLSIYLSIYHIILLFISVLFIMVGELYWNPISVVLERIGDVSYGVYIYSFPLQQMLIAKITEIHPIQLLLLTIIIVLPIAYLSWCIIEKPSLSLKKYL